LLAWAPDIEAAYPILIGVPLRAAAVLLAPSVACAAPDVLSEPQPARANVATAARPPTICAVLLRPFTFTVTLLLAFCPPHHGCEAPRGRLGP
jgi:hypothetical protein